MKAYSLNSFTLQELLIVLVIISILILLALPNLMPLIGKAKSTEAKIQLEHVYHLQKSYFMEHSRYTNDLDKIQFEQIQLNSDKEGGKANYAISIESADSRSFIAKASSVNDFDGDGIYNVWQIDQDKNLVEILKD